MKKTLILFGVFSILVIMFLGMRIDTEILVKDSVSTFMKNVDFTKRTLVSASDLIIKEEKEDTDQAAVETKVEKEKVIVIEKYTHSSQTARVLDKESVEVYVQPLMQIGNQGEYVSELQEILNEKGYDIAIDGIFGVETQDAVEAFQTDTGIQIDGIVGIETWGELLNL